MENTNYKYKKNTLFIDESGNPGMEGRFFVIGVVSFQGNEDYKKLSHIIQRTIKNDITLRIEGEMKGFYMDYELKKEVLEAVRRNNIRFNAWFVIIDTDDDQYINNFINNKKDPIFNEALNYLFQHRIADIIQSNDINLEIDNQNFNSKSIIIFDKYLNHESIVNKAHQCNSVVVNYHDSKDSYGVQFADLLSNIIYQRYEKNKCISLFNRYILPHVPKNSGVVKYYNF